MTVGIEVLFTSALGLQPPWVVEDVKLDTAKRRIDFEVGCQGAVLTCPQCGAAAQPVHDRLRRSWRHLDFFQFEAWLHADVPRVGCAACGKTSQVVVPWAREGSGFTLLFEALALAVCRDMPVKHAAALLRCADKHLWRVTRALGAADRKSIKGLMWGMRKNPCGWTRQQTNAMHWLQRSSLKSARAWRLKMALREVYARAAASNDARLASADLNAWLSWARRSRLESFKKLARTITQRADAVVRGMTDNRSNAFVEAMNGVLQQIKRAARGFRTAKNFIAIAYLRMSKLKHLPAHPFAAAAHR